MWNDGLWEMVEELSGWTFSREEDDWLQDVVRVMPVRVDEALRLRRARRPDRIALAETSAWSIVWFAVAASLPDDAERKRQIVEMGRRAARRVGETLPASADYLVAGAAIAAARAEDVVDATVGAEEAVTRFVEEIRDEVVARFEALLSGGTVDDLESHALWQGQSLALVEAIPTALSRPRAARRLEAIAAAHRRASGEALPTVPTLGIGDIGWFPQMQLPNWILDDDPRHGRTHAVCVHRQLIFLGEHMERAAVKSAEAGRLNTLLMHELLHTVQHRTATGEGDERRLDAALMEGAHQGWAERVCRAARDPITGMTGAGYTRAYLGWKYAVAAIASATGRNPDAAVRLVALANDDSFSGTVAKWCPERSREGFADRLWPVMERAFHDRNTAGVGPRTAAEAVAALDLRPAS